MNRDRGSLGYLIGVEFTALPMVLVNAPESYFPTEVPYQMRLPFLPSPSPFHD
jgi:hypothetical protein